MLFWSNTKNQSCPVITRPSGPWRIAGRGMARTCWRNAPIMTAVNRGKHQHADRVMAEKDSS